jgi:hypothetical protein
MSTASQHFLTTPDLLCLLVPYLDRHTRALSLRVCKAFCATITPALYERVDLRGDGGLLIGLGASTHSWAPTTTTLPLPGQSQRAPVAEEEPRGRTLQRTAKGEPTANVNIPAVVSTTTRLPPSPAPSTKTRDEPVPSTDLAIPLPPSPCASDIALDEEIVVETQHDVFKWDKAAALRFVRQINVYEHEDATCPGRLLDGQNLFPRLHTLHFAGGGRKLGQGKLCAPNRCPFLIQGCCDDHALLDQQCGVETLIYRDLDKASQHTLPPRKISRNVKHFKLIIRQCQLPLTTGLNELPAGTPIVGSAASSTNSTPSSSRSSSPSSYSRYPLVDALTSQCPRVEAVDLVFWDERHKHRVDIRERSADESLGLFMYWNQPDGYVHNELLCHFHSQYGCLRHLPSPATHLSAITERIGRMPSVKRLDVWNTKAMVFPSYSPHAEATSSEMDSLSETAALSTEEEEAAAAARENDRQMAIHREALIVDSIKEGFTLGRRPNAMLEAASASLAGLGAATMETEEVDDTGASEADEIIKFHSAQDYVDYAGPRGEIDNDEWQYWEQEALLA